jgi:hypothetical protein
MPIPYGPWDTTNGAPIDEVSAGYVFRDTFTRTNHATSLGSLEKPAGSAFAWQVLAGSGTGWGINGNAAYHPGGNYGIAFAETAAVAMTSMTVSAGADEEFWLIFRIFDNQNYYRFGHPASDATYVVEKIEANALGTITTSLQISAPPDAADGDKIMVVTRDNDGFDCWVNGVRIFGCGDVEWMNSYKVGIGAGSSTPDLRIAEFESIPMGGGVSPVQQPIIASLAQDISATHVEAEVQAISTKVDAILTALRASGVIRT